MVDKEKGGTSHADDPKPNSIQTKMVLLVQRPDGTGFSKSFTRDEELPVNVVLKDSIPGKIKEFEKLPKSITFLFEKGF